MPNAPLSPGPTPLDVLRQSPGDQPLLLLDSGRFHPRWSRQSLLASPQSAVRVVLGRDGQPRTEWLGTPPRGGAPEFTDRPLSDLRRALATDADALWIGYISYDIGRFIERLPTYAAADRDWPILQFHRCPVWHSYDLASAAWTSHGRAGDSDPLRELLAAPPSASPARSAGFRCGELRSASTREAHEAAVRRAVEYIHAGDAFQVNLAQRFSAGFSGDARELYTALAQASTPWYGACLELMSGQADEPRRTIASSSPELFFELDAEGNVLTRPIKGTRPASAPAEELLHSEKDAAELHMIVDLIRNDLGRVCSYGTVKVEQAREIESHPTVHHGVATITGRLHPSRDLIHLLRATLPGGSITGAPKVRAMEIIDELEPVRRGPYCGAIGWIRGGAACLNIAIRTMLVEQPQGGEGRVDFSVGGGIVADSDPAGEYQETLDKAAAMLAALAQGEAQRPDVPVKPRSTG